MCCSAGLTTEDQVASTSAVANENKRTKDYFSEEKTIVRGLHKLLVKERAHRLAAKLVYSLQRKLQEH